MGAEEGEKIVGEETRGLVDRGGGGGRTEGTGGIGAIAGLEVKEPEKEDIGGKILGG